MEGNSNKTSPLLTDLEAADLKVGADAVDAIKAAKASGEGAAGIARRVAEMVTPSISPMTEGGLPKVIIPKFSGADGHKLTPDEQLVYIKEHQPTIPIPHFDGKTGQPMNLSAEEKVEWLRRNYS